MQHSVAGPHSGKVIKHTFLGCKDMQKKATWGGGNFTHPLDIVELNRNIDDGCEIRDWR